MSDHTLCDKCSKVIDKTEQFFQVVVTQMAADENGSLTIVTPSVTYDYHPNHVPKFDKGNMPDTEEEEVNIEHHEEEPT
jgi:hypothetical protein